MGNCKIIPDLRTNLKYKKNGTPRTEAEIDSLIIWMKTKVQCDCGLLIENGKKANHLKGELHDVLLNHYDYENIKGTDKIKCTHCNLSITVCGLPAHHKFKHAVKSSKISFDIKK